MREDQTGLGVVDEMTCTVFGTLLNNLFPSKPSAVFSLDIIQDPDMMYGHDLMTRVVISQGGDTVAFTKFYLRKLVHVSALMLVDMMRKNLEAAGLPTGDDPFKGMMSMPDELVDMLKEWVDAWHALSAVTLPGIEGIGKYRVLSTGELYHTMFLDMLINMVTMASNAGEYDAAQD